MSNKYTYTQYELDKIKSILVQHPTLVPYGYNCSPKDPKYQEYRNQGMSHS